PPPAPPSFPTRRSSDLGHRLEIGTRRVAVLDRAVAHGRGQEALRVGLAPLSCVGARGVTPDGGRDPEIRDADAVEKRAQLAPHLDRKSTRLNSSHVAIS